MQSFDRIRATGDRSARDVGAELKAAYERIA